MLVLGKFMFILLVGAGERNGVTNVWIPFMRSERRGIEINATRARLLECVVVYWVRCVSEC